jgi:hypothetical protein
MPPRQRDLFLDDEADLDEDRPTPVFRADPNKVREKLHKTLAEARAAQTLPWSAHQTRLYQTIVRQMVNWLPDDEAAQPRFEFETELARLACPDKAARPSYSTTTRSHRIFYHYTIAPRHLPV